MHNETLIFGIFLIFAGAAILSTVALITRQSMLVAYMLIGMLLGPSGFKLFANVAAIHNVGEIGIIFLLFLLGLHLPPQKLIHMMRQITWVGLISSLIFAVCGFLVGHFNGFNFVESAIIGAAMMFSSTIIGIKLLPTTVLHHQHTGEVMVSVLLFQDILAIIVLLLLHGGGISNLIFKNLLHILIGFSLVLLFAVFFERFVLMPLVARFNRIKEYIFLLSIAWCLLIAEFALKTGLSAEIGAFIAGVALATSPISVYIAESLRPLRDFFLVMFFFAVGASFDLNYLRIVIIPAVILIALLMLIKPLSYRFLLQWVGEEKQVGWEVGIRLAQISEFSLIIANTALATGLISKSATYLIEATTIISFVISSYWVVMRYPTPIALSDQLRRD